MKCVKTIISAFVAIFYVINSILFANIHYSTKLESKKFPVDLSFSLEGEWETIPASNLVDSRQVRVFKKKSSEYSSIILLSITEIPSNLLPAFEKEFSTQAFARDLASVDDSKAILLVHKVVNNHEIEFVNAVNKNGIGGCSVSRCIKKDNALILLKLSYVASIEYLSKDNSHIKDLQGNFMKEIEAFHKLCSSIKIER